jgi:hypothetical protein
MIRIFARMRDLQLDMQCAPAYHLFVANPPLCRVSMRCALQMEHCAVHGVGILVCSIVYK